MDSDYELQRRALAAKRVLARDMTIAGLRLSDRANPEEGVVVNFDAAEAAAVMATIGEIMQARIAAARAQLEI